MKNIFKILCLCIVIVTAFVGCKAAAPVDTGFPVTAAGVTISQKPERVVCLTQGAVEAVKYFAGEDIIVNGKQDVTADEIISLSPDIVFSNEQLSESDMQKLKLAGVKVAVVPVPVYFSELIDYYSDFIKLLFGSLDVQTRVTGAMYELSTPILTETAYSALLMPQADTVATPDTVMGTLLHCAGYKNAADGCKDFIMSKEAIFDAQPQVIFCGAGVKEALAADPVLSKIPAVVNNMVYEIDTDALRLPGNRFAQVISDMSNAVLQSNTNTQSTSSIGE